MMRNVKRIRIYRRYDDTKEWVADCLVSLTEYPEIHDCVPDLREDVKKIIEGNLLIVKRQIWLTGEIPVSEEIYGWVCEDLPEETKEKA
jgi:hypothetical protein